MWNLIFPGLIFHWIYFLVLQGKGWSIYSLRSFHLRGQMILKRKIILYSWTSLYFWLWYLKLLLIGYSWDLVISCRLKEFLTNILSKIKVTSNLLLSKCKLWFCKLKYEKTSVLLALLKMVQFHILYTFSTIIIVIYCKFLYVTVSFLIN